MVREVILPQLGETMDSGTVARWYKGEGERVEKGEPLLAVETDKATIDVEAQQSGYLVRILVGEGVTVPTTEVIGYMAERPDETVGDLIGAGSAGEVVVDAAQSGAIAAGPAVENDRVEKAETPDTGPPVRVSPAARRIAREHGIDPTRLKGSGPGGRVVEADVRRVIGEQEAPPSVPAAEAAGGLAAPTGSVLTAAADRGSVSGEATDGWDLVPLSRIRRIIGERLSRTHLEAVHVTLHREADVTEAARLRAQLNREWELQLGVKVTYTDLLVKACARALGEHRELNASLGSDGIRLHRRINIGVAMAVPAGLVVPVLRDCDLLPLVEIARAIRQLTERARSGGIMPDEMAGGTFTVTNMGMMGVDHFTPIINGVECAILGTGRVGERAAVVEGSVVSRLTMPLSLSFDHRIVDGALAAAFLARVIEVLENPYLILI